MQPDVYAVQGYDAAQMLAIGLNAVEGRREQEARTIAAAMETRRSTARAGAFTMSQPHNPMQDIYLRQVDGKENKVIGVATQGARRSRPRLQDVGAGDAHASRRTNGSDERATFLRPIP